jgi:quinol monooxygenase YgiN
MVYLNIVLTVKDESDIGEVTELMKRQSEMSRLEPGCERFEVYHSQSDPKVFIINEWWESEAALETHRGAKACEEVYKPLVLPKVDRVPHVCEVLE